MPTYASNIAKQLDKLEEAFIEGNYDKALRKADKIIKKTKTASPNGISAAHLGNAYLWKAHVLAIYRGNDFETIQQYVDLGIETLQAYETADLPLIKGYIKATEVYLDYGHFTLAQQSVDEAIALANDETRHLVQRAHARCLMHTGYYQEAAKELSAALPVIDEKTKRHITILDLKSGKEKKIKLKRRDYIAVKRDYANSLNLMAEIFIRQGDYEKGDSALRISKQYIDKELHKKDLSGVRYMYLTAIRHDALGEHFEVTELLEKALRYGSKNKYGLKYISTSREYLDMEELQMYNYWALGKGEAGNKLKRHFHTRAKVRYGKNNVMAARVDYHEYLREKLDNDMKDAEKLMDGIIADEQKLPSLHPIRLEILKEAYQFYKSIDKPFKALQAIQQIKESHEVLVPEGSPLHHAYKCYEADAMANFENQFDKAESIYLNSYKEIIADAYHPGHPDYLLFNNQLFDLYLLTEQLEKASETVNYGVSIAEKHFGKLDYRAAAQQRQKARYLMQKGQYNDAEKLLTDALSAFEKVKGNLKKKNEVALLHRSYAKLNLLISNFPAAETHLRKYQNMADISKDNEKDINDFAILYIKTGNFSRVRSTLQGQLETYKQRYGNEDRRLISILNNLAFLDLNEGNYTNANKLIDQSLTISQQIYGINSLSFAKGMDLQAQIQVAIGDYENAIKSYDKVITTQQNILGDNHILNAKAISRRALAKLYDGDASKAIEDELIYAQEIIRKALSSEDKLRRSMEYAEALQNHAFYHIEVGDLESAGVLLEKARAIWENTDVDNKLEIAQIDLLEGRMAQESGEYGKAVKKYNSAMNGYRRAFGRSHPDYIHAQSQLGQVFYIMGDQSRALREIENTTTAYLEFIQKYFPYQSEREKAKYWNKIKPDFEFYNTMAFNSGNKKLIRGVYEQTLATKALLLNSSIQLRENILRSGDDAIKEQFNEWVILKEQMASALSMTEEQRKNNDINLDNLEDDIKNIEKKLSQESEVFAAQRQDKFYNWKDVRGVLKEGEAVVEIIRYRYFDKTFTDSIIYKGLVITPETNWAPEVIDFGNGNDMETKYANYYRNAHIHKFKDKYSYNTYWAPLAKALGNTRKIYLSSEGVFNQLNLEAILKPDGSYVIDSMEIVMVSNSKDVVTHRNRAQKETSKKEEKKIVGIGNPAFYEHNAENTKTLQLPGTEKEVLAIKDIAKQHGSTPYLFMAEEATEDTIKNLPFSPHVYHFATHGFFKPHRETSSLTSGFDNNRAIMNPLLRSGLYMRGAGDIVDKYEVFNYNIRSGVLTAYEAMNMNLGNTELVVLSACESGLGDITSGEGVYGLQRSFLVAGAKNVIMSLFKVSDEVTYLLMKEFYSNWFETGDKRAAFTHAKKAIREQYPDPIYWGSFVMIGMD